MTDTHIHTNIDTYADTNGAVKADIKADTDAGPMEFKAFDELDAILDDLRTRRDETPQWEFCEGFMAALICCRRLIPPSEYLAVLLDFDAGPGAAQADGDLGSNELEASGEGLFANDAQLQRFMALWVRRWNEVAEALNTPVETLDDARAYYPEVMDVRGALAKLSPEERADVPGDDIPSFGQVWGLGFMCAVENWPDEWTAPRDREAGKILDDALQAIIALTDDDVDTPAVCVYEEGGAPTVSNRRLGEFADAVWAAYDLREVRRTIGPRVETVRAEVKPGRNDPCFCGSGKKYKKCHGV